MTKRVNISVITVAYNSSATILDAVNSVIHQTHAAHEHIIIDGNSRDDTVKKVSEINSENIKIISENDSGIYDAMNKGILNSTGDVIGFLNSDDYFYDENVLKNVAIAFQDESIDACFGDLIYVSNDKSKVVRYWISAPFEKGSFLKGWSPAHPTFYIRKAILNEFGLFNTKLRLASDFEFMMRILDSDSIKSLYLPRVFVCMRVGGVTNASWRNIYMQNKEILLTLKARYNNFSLIAYLYYKIITRIYQYTSVQKK
jgi:glycosyltransferase involved in cell wall biosynthesis